MTEIRLEIFGEDVIARRLERFGENISDLRPLFNRIIPVLEQIAEETFATKDHGSWPPLSPKYKEWKDANYPGKPMMRLTDRLYNSLTGKGSGAVRIIGPATLTYGTTVPYGIMHQKGGSILPQRRVIHLTPEDKKRIMKEVQRFLVEASQDLTE